AADRLDLEFGYFEIVEQRRDDCLDARLEPFYRSRAECVANEMAQTRMLAIVHERCGLRIPEIELAAPMRERTSMPLCRVGEQTVVVQYRRRVFVRRDHAAVQFHVAMHRLVRAQFGQQRIRTTEKV